MQMLILTQVQKMSWVKVENMSTIEISTLAQVII